MAHIKQSRLMSGPDAGKLRICIDVRINASDESLIGCAIGSSDETYDNLDMPIQKRSIGPAANAAADAMWNGLAELIERGRTGKPLRFPLRQEDSRDARP